MKNQDIIFSLKTIAQAKNITSDQEEELKLIIQSIQSIQSNNQFENRKQILYLILKIITGSDNFPDYFN